MLSTFLQVVLFLVQVSPPGSPTHIAASVKPGREGDKETTTDYAHYSSKAKTERERGVRPSVHRKPQPEPWPVNLVCVEIQLPIKMQAVSKTENSGG